MATSQLTLGARLPAGMDGDDDVGLLWSAAGAALPVPVVRCFYNAHAQPRSISELVQYKTHEQH